MFVGSLSFKMLKKKPNSEVLKITWGEKWKAGKWHKACRPFGTLEKKILTSAYNLFFTFTYFAAEILHYVSLYL